MIPCGLIKTMEKSCCRVSDPTCSTLIQTPVHGLQVPGKHHNELKWRVFFIVTVFFDETAKKNLSLGWRLKFDTTGVSRYTKVFEMQKLSKLWGASTNAELAVEMTMKWENPCTAHWVNQWIKNQRINEPVDRWINKSTSQWISEAQNQWTNDAMIQRRNEPIKQRINKSMNHWSKEPMRQWVNSMNQWTVIFSNDSMNLEHSWTLLCDFLPSSS